jgi:hypothetical protein
MQEWTRLETKRLRPISKHHPDTRLQKPRVTENMPKEVPDRDSKQVSLEQDLDM